MFSAGFLPQRLLSTSYRSSETPRAAQAAAAAAVGTRGPPSGVALRPAALSVLLAQLGKFRCQLVDPRLQINGSLGAGLCLPARPQGQEGWRSAAGDSGTKEGQQKWCALQQSGCAQRAGLHRCRRLDPRCGEQARAGRPAQTVWPACQRTRGRGLPLVAPCAAAPARQSRRPAAPRAPPAAPPAPRQSLPCTAGQGPNSG